MVRLPVFPVTCSAIALLAACDMSVDPNQGWTEITGTMHQGQGITMPEEVTAGQSFVVKFNTDGGSNGCYRPAPAKVVETSTQVQIEPRILVNANEGVVCDAIFIAFPHRVTLRFSQPGSVHVVIRGLNGDSTDSPPDTLTFERTVVVR